MRFSCSGERGVRMACRSSIGSFCGCADVDLSSLLTVEVNDDLSTAVGGSLSAGGIERFCRFLLRACFSAKAFCWAPAMASFTASKRRSSAS